MILSAAPPNYGFKLTSRLAALARDQLGSISLAIGASAASRRHKPKAYSGVLPTGATAGSQLNPVRYTPRELATSEK